MRFMSASITYSVSSAAPMKASSLKPRYPIKLPKMIGDIKLREDFCCIFHSSWKFLARPSLVMRTSDFSQPDRCASAP